MDGSDDQRRTTFTRAAMRDIAVRAGVSVATVSRVLNGRPDVALATRDAVLRHVRETGYVSNRVARAGWETRLIALSAPLMRGDHMTRMITGAAEAFEEYGARLVICANGGRGAPLPALRERLMQGATDGALLIQPTDSNADLLTLHESGFPFVVIDPLVPLDERIPVIAAANWAGAKAATEHLIGLGHTHIGLITGPPERCVSVDRLAGYQAALLAAGLPFVPALVQQADMEVEGGAAAARRLLCRPHAPTAIFAVSDQLAFGVLRAARDLGLRTPRDVSVVGFDDLEMAAVVTPALTTIQQPFQGIGRAGADALQRILLGQPLHAARVELSTRLVVRESTAAPPGTSFLTY